MKFSEMTYTRPDFADARAQYAEILSVLESAPDAAAQIAAVDRYNRLRGHLYTMASLCYVRHTVDTRDAFYDAENDYIDEQTPTLAEPEQRIARAMLASPFRAELEAHYGKLLFTNLEIEERSFTPEMVPLMQQENKLSSEYQKLYASAVVEFDGKKLPLPRLTPYLQSPDRAVRKAAFETQARFFDAHQDELDRIYDELVKNRTAQARLLGYENFLPLGFDRMGRNCYGPAEVAAFRDQIARDLVPIVARVKRDQAKRLGLDALKFYDDPLLFPDGNARPQGTAEEILAAGLEMYHGLSAETAEFVDVLYGGELLDVLSKEGKAPGGYCTDLYEFGVPFIFSNFNGTSGDVDVLTHEAGHAFAFYRAMKQGLIPQLLSPTMEACECHSMSMEFLTAPYHHLFFGDATEKYELGHCEDALIFIPYGCMVDEFQTRVYEQPDLTPAQRNALWLELEKKFRPWVDYDNLPFFSRGALWQRQMHIYQSPFYYIDYCMAQTVAFQFWMASLADRADAWRRYLAFVDKGGTQTFEQLVHGAGLKVPYEEGCIRAIGEAVSRWIDAHELS